MAIAPSRNRSPPAAQAQGNSVSPDGLPIGVLGRGSSLSDQVSPRRAARAGDKVLDAKAQVERRTTVSPRRVPGLLATRGLPLAALETVALAQDAVISRSRYISHSE